MTALDELQEYNQYRVEVSPATRKGHFVQKPIRNEQSLNQIISMLKIMTHLIRADLGEYLCLPIRIHYLAAKIMVGGFDITFVYSKDTSILLSNL